MFFFMRADYEKMRCWYDGYSFEGSESVYYTAQNYYEIFREWPAAGNALSRFCNLITVAIEECEGLLAVIEIRETENAERSARLKTMMLLWLMSVTVHSTGLS